MTGRQKALWLAALLAVPCLLIDTSAGAQAPAGRGPRGAGAGGAPRAQHEGASRDPSAAAAGAYKLDSDHASIVFRILHEGTSYSTFRFYTDAGTLDWNPAQIESSKVEVTVDTKSLATPVVNFADRLTGEHYLNSAKFPQARFVSTGIRRTGPTAGEITGDLTLLGVTKPLVVEADLVGVGPNARGVPTVGFKGVAKLKRSDFGLMTLLPSIADEVELQIDIEFNRQG